MLIALDKLENQGLKQAIVVVPERSIEASFHDEPEGFDWIWCEHALTVGYRSSLTEIIQIVGRATRDGPSKTRARFTNLIAEPDASEQAVTEAVNDTLKAIAASLLMEQVVAPRFEFKPKHPNNEPTPGSRLDLELKDRFGSQVEPKEWFLVPLDAIEETIGKLKEWNIGSFRYDSKKAKIISI
jgi:hypothetical protein